MKSANSRGNGKAVMKHQAMRREVAHLSADLSRIGKEAESAGAEASGGPEENAAENMGNGLGYSALAVTGVLASKKRMQYIRQKSAQEKILRKESNGPAANIPGEKTADFPNTPDISDIPDVLNTSFYTQGDQIPKVLQQKNRIRHQFLTQKTSAKQAEIRVLSKNTAATHRSVPPRLQHWQNSTRQQFFLRHAARQKLEKQAAASSGSHLIATAHLSKHYPHSFSTMRSSLHKGVERALNKVASAITKTIHVAVQSIPPLIGAGGIVLLLMMVIGAAAAIIGSPMGILFADEASDPNAVHIASIVQEVNSDFAQKINEIVDAHPECDEVDIQYVYENGRTWASYWPEILAVFAVQNNLGADGNVVVIDAANAQKIHDTFWEMHQITSEIETVEIIPEAAEDQADESSNEDNADDEDEGDTTPQYRYILHISVMGKSADDMADAYHFTADQRDILHQLLSAEMRPMLQVLCGSAMGSAAAGDMQWPLPGFTTISCQFGEPDAIRGLPHKGTDIPAPEGTPIVAAHDSTVLISGWNDSYGNQVLLDNGSGLSTRYAHMIETAVSIGETVSAGQVIGYVGSTGDSTGSHLHFEICIDGVRTDAMGYFTVQ